MESNFLERVQQWLNKKHQSFSDPDTYFERLKSNELNSNIEDCICNAVLDKAVFEMKRGNNSDPFLWFLVMSVNYLSQI